MSGGEELPDIDTGLLAQLNGAGIPAPAPAPDGDVDTGLLHQLNTSAPPAVTTAPHAIAHHTAPTQFQKSTAPPAPNEPEPSWGDVGASAIKNAVPSLVGVGKSIADSVMHPIKTAEAIGNLGKGAVSQAAGALGVQQDPKTKAANEALISAMENHYKTTYGSVRGFKRAVATDPASVLMDASTVIPGVGAATDAAGLARTAAVINKVGAAIDPVQAALKVAAIPAKAAMGVGRQFSGMTTGVAPSVLKLAADAGAHPNPAVGAAFKKFASGQGDATEFQRAAQGAVSSIKQDMSDAYLGQKGPMANKPVDLSGAQQAVQDATTKAQMGARVGQVPQKAMDAINEAASMVNDVANDPARNTIEHVDALKQQLWDLKTLHPMADTYLNGIYHGVRNDLFSADPEYAQMMEKYQDAMANINDLTKTAVGTPRAAASASLAKSLRAMKTGTGTNLMSQLMEKDPTIGGMLAGQATQPVFAGGRSALEAALAVPAAGAIFSHPLAAAAAIPVSLAASSPRLAGAVNFNAGRLARTVGKVPAVTDAPYYAGRVEEQADQPDDVQVAQPDINTAKAAVSGVESAGSGGYNAIGPTIHHNGIVDHAVGKYQVMASNIPKWTQQVLGHEMTPDEFRLDPDAQEKVFETIFGRYLAKYGNMRDALSAWHSGVPLAQAISENRHDPNMTTQQYVKKAGFKRGGKVGKTHEQLVERLMKMARAAKKGEAEKTEPLLKVPDETVIRALEVAQRAI